MGDAFGAGIIDFISRADIIEYNNRKTSSNIALNTFPNNQSRISLQRVAQSNISVQRISQSNRNSQS